MPEPLDLALIVNPMAGNGRVAKELPALRERLEDAGHSYEVMETERANHARELAQMAASGRFDVVVAVVT